jgi:hypothetical protein
MIKPKSNRMHIPPNRSGIVPFARTAFRFPESPFPLAPSGDAGETGTLESRERIMPHETKILSNSQGIRRIRGKIRLQNVDSPIQ